MSIESNKDKSAVIFIAHPDDEERAVAATSQLIQTGWNVSFVLWTNGEGGEIRGVREETRRFSELVANIRLREFYESMNYLGIRDVTFVNQPDGCLKPTEKLIDTAAQIIVDKKASLVMTTTEEAGESAHPDHLNSRVIIGHALNRASSLHDVEYAAGIDMMQPLKTPDHLVDATKSKLDIKYLLWKVYRSQNDFVDGRFFSESLSARGRLLASLTNDPKVSMAEAYQQIPGYQVLPFGYSVSKDVSKELLKGHRPPSYKDIQLLNVAA